MGLYLCIFDGDDDIDGVEVGPYSDFGGLRDYIVRELEGGSAGSRFPTLILHSDCDGEWAVAECARLRNELAQIRMVMQARPPIPFISDWQKDVAQSFGLSPKNAFESFIDVNGDFILERIQQLVDVALERQLPISFQ
jgi:Immunity protein 70